MSKFQNRRLRKFSWVTGACLVSAFVLGPTTAQAEDADDKKSSVRYERKSSKVKAKATLDTKFKEQVKAQEKKDKRKVDMMQGAQFAKKREAVKQQIADTQIKQLQRLLKATDMGHPDYPDLVFRLADHHLEKKAYFELQEGSLYEKIYLAEEKGKTSEVKQLKAKQKKFVNAAKSSSADAVKLYQHLTTTDRLSKYKRIDEALYFLAFELGQLKRESEMKATYIKLIQNYPNSKYIPNAYLSFADYYFGQQKIQEALKLYEKVITFKDSPVYAYALYKMAWCHLNPIGTAEPRYDLSLQFFINTIKATLEGRAGSEANARQLRRDARRDLIQAYVHVGSTTKAWDFFQKFGDGPKDDENMSRKMMELLAVRYFGNGKYTESTFTYHKLQDLYPDDPATCEWQGRVVINALATDNKGVQWDETEKLGQYWTKFRDGDFKKSVKRKCRDETLDTMKQMATVWHDEAEKTKSADTYDLAEKAYKGFLTVFPKDKDAYELQLYYAELLWARAGYFYSSKDKDEKEIGRKKFKDAHDEFIKVLELNPEGKYTQDAAYAQMLAMKNYLEYDETGGQGKGCKTNAEGVCVYKDKKKKKKIKVKKSGGESKDGKIDVESEYPISDYTEDETSMLDSYNVYMKYVKDKNDKELPKITYHRAKLMMVHNKFDEARPLLEQMVTKFDGTLYAAWCSEMLLDLLTITWLDSRNSPQDTLKAGDNLFEWGTKLQKMKVYKHPEADRLREAIPMLLAGIRWQKGMAYLEDGRQTGNTESYKKCAETFLEIYNDYGDEHEKADTLIWNSTLCYDASYLLGQAVRWRKFLLEKFPDSKHYKDTLDYLGGNYQAIAMYGKAAERLEAYADKYKKDEDSAVKLQNAYLFRLGLGEEDQAETNLRKFESFYKAKNPQKAAKIFWSKHDLLKSDSEKIDHAKAYLKAYGKKGGNDRRIVAEAAIGQILWRQSCKKGLLYDSCITIQRKKAKPGEKSRQRQKELKRKARMAKKKKQDDDGSGKKGKEKIEKFCGTATAGIITVHDRDSKIAKEAQKRFSTVKSLAKSKVDIPPDDLRRIEDFRNAVAMAQVYSADVDYEEYLTVEMPGDLNFHVEEYKKDSGLPKWEKEYKEQVKKRDDSVKRFSDFMEKKLKLGQKLITAYDGVVAQKQSPYWMLAAAARSAMVSQNFADQLYRAEVPKNFKTEEEYFAYCDALSDKAVPIEQAALEKFTYCLDRSTTFQFFNEFSRLCEAELQQRDPDKYPSTEELFGTSEYTAARPDRVEVQLDLEGEKRKVSLSDNKKKDSEAEKDEESKDDEG